MTNRISLFFDALSAVASSNEAGDWMLVLPLGRKTRDGRGPFTVRDRAQAEAALAATLAYFGGTDPVVNYDHDEKGPAAGWVKEFQARDDGFWARIVWTAKAREQIAAGEYRYLSPEIIHRKDGQVDRLHHVALVNRPAFDLAATAASATEETAVEFMAKLREALGLAADASETAILEAVAGNATKLAAAALKPVALAAGLPETATAADIAAAFTTRGEGPTAAQFAALQADATRLAAELATIKQAAVVKEAEELVDGAIRDGIPGFNQASRADYVAMAVKSADGMAAVRKFVANTPRLGGGSVIPAAVDAGGKVTALSAEHADAVKKLGLDPAKYLETLNKERAA